MLIDIDRIVVSDRIRKDFGDIQELADDIKENGLINPPVVNKEYVLLAGERRLRACKLLGWQQIEVRMMDTRDAEHELNIEITENECRKEFTKTERLEYARRLARIEAIKSKERMVAGRAVNPTADLPQGETRNIVAAQLGTSATQLRREQFIADNADMLDPSDFAEWDEGKLSTNKAYQRIKAAKEQAERERDDARETVSMVQRVADALKAERDEARDEIAALEKQNDELYELANNQQVVTREVEVKVVPDDYETLKHDVAILKTANKRFAEQHEKLRGELDEARNGGGTVEQDILRLAADIEMVERRHREIANAWTDEQLDSVSGGALERLAQALTSLTAIAEIAVS